MNGKTAKLIRRYAAALRLSERKLRRDWKRYTRKQRTVERQVMAGIVKLARAAA